MTFPNQSSGADVLAVVVAYERDLAQIEAWPFLATAVGSQPKAPDGLRIGRVVVYDNSSICRTSDAALLPGCEHVHNPDNGGTAAAYTYAARRAIEGNFAWMLLLDHDTRLPLDFFDHADAAIRLRADKSPAALLPWILHGQQAISPSRVDRLGRVRPLHRGTPIPPPADTLLTGISSGSLISVGGWREIAPLPPELWLDYIDHWIFVSMQSAGLRIGVFDAILQHDLSLETPSALSPSRTRSILAGEAFWVKGLSRPARYAYPFRLLLRALGYLRHGGAQSGIVARSAVQAFTALWR